LKGHIYLLQECPFDPYSYVELIIKLKWLEPELLCRHTRWHEIKCVSVSYFPSSSYDPD
jgi:hypothetical protein